MRCSATPRKESISTSTLPEQLGVLVARRHHLLVRWSHWLNVPILLGLILSGISIYWSSPIYQHKPDPNTGNFDVAADIGIWICAHVPWLHHYNSPPDWIYNHMSLGPGMLALALRLHWLCAYAFMLNGAVYVADDSMKSEERFKHMPKVRVAGFGVSLDGFSAGPEQNIDNPLGKRGPEIFQWFFHTKTFRAMHGQDGGSTDLDDEFAFRSMDNFGA